MGVVYSSAAGGPEGRGSSSLDPGFGRSLTDTRCDRQGPVSFHR